MESRLKEVYSRRIKENREGWMLWRAWRSTPFLKRIFMNEPPIPRELPPPLM